MAMVTNISGSLPDNFNEQLTTDTVQSIFAAIGASLGVFSVCLSLTLLIALVYLKNYQTAYHRLMINMALADLLASLTFMVILWPTDPLSQVRITEKYYLFLTLPYVWRSVPWMFFTVYVLTLSCLTVTQYIAVCTPEQYTNHVTNRLVRNLLVLIWSVSFIQILVPLSLLFAVLRHDDPTDVFNTLHFVYSIETRIWLFVFLLSSLIDIVLHIFVYRSIRKMRQRFGNPSSLSCTSQNTLRTKQEIFKTVTLLLSASVVCRLPFPVVGNFYQNMEISPKTAHLINSVLIFLLNINFCVDSVIYILRMKDVRRIYSLALTRKCRAPQNSDHNDSLAENDVDAIL